MSSLTDHPQHLGNLLRDTQALLRDPAVRRAHRALSIYAARLADALEALGDVEVFLANARR